MSHFLADHFSTPLSQTASFGDDLVDISMLQQSGRGGTYQIRFVKCMISPGQFYVKCSLSPESTGIWKKSVLFFVA